MSTTSASTSTSNDTTTQIPKAGSETALPIPDIPSKLKQTGFNWNPKRVSDDVVYWNCENPKFYETAKPENPLFSVWILSASKGVGYANRRFFEEAFLQNIEVKIARINKFNLSMSQKGLRSIYYEGELVTEDTLPDCVIPRLGANVNATGLSVIRQLEAMDILVLNPISSIDLSRNKLYTMQLLASHNMPIPKTMMVAQPPFEMDMIRQEFDFPIVLKRASGSQGKGVMLIQSEELLEDIADMLDSRSPLIFQEFIENSKGRDLRVWVMGGRCIGAMMRVATKGFKANIHQNGIGKNVKLSSAVEWLAIETAKLLGLDMAGVDILIDKDTYKLCEVNASPGFEGLEAATGINVPTQMLDFIKLRLGLWRKQTKKNKKFSVSIPVQEDHERKTAKKEEAAQQQTK
mmetsp:Transcript_7196/g.26952  ORF Transcript_7196/g.26952 Transcript_7196/m.26952 type:complete len:405 (-) Transcript_7196:181-1395(-)|eukprot:CAMPEP_0117450066 /NCGR_PEP_ID=MMETSP0759-20121206/8273_1 /TAXON_ID=63605 /ORGANISM="Percolomonas cosmopolitus, Strain WS" /LENGTH=404 /DNA_ID=CAMNT_0005242569 /DNA_START=95 /DNA_END=1309 /DNA_ORIENTATION=-